MNSRSLGQLHPLMRLLLPLVCGIVCADSSQALRGLGAETLWVVCFLSCCLAGLSVYLQRFWFGRLFPLFLYLSLFLLGATVTSRAWSKSDYAFSGTYETFWVRLVDQPQEKPRSVLCHSLLLERRDSSGIYPLEKEFLLYLAKDSQSLALVKGDELLVHVRLAPPVLSGIPDEFDYPRYLYRKGICGTGYVPADSWRLTGHKMGQTWADRLGDVRRRLMERYRQLGFQGDELALLSALTVGVRDDLSDEVREVYSVTGAAHTLALSGLHIGVLYAVLWLLFSPLWRMYGKLKIPCMLVVVSLLWMFAALTGFPVSVVRSVAMFSLIGLSSLGHERPHTLNTLAAAAFFMLLFRPLWLFEAGFQMSFAAVACIALFYKRLAALLPMNGKLMRRLRDLFLISLCASVGVAPLIAFHFHRFSVYSLLTSLWVVPMLSLVIYGAVLMLLLTPFPEVQQWVAMGENFLLREQLHWLESVSRWPGATVDGIYLSLWEVGLFYAVVWCGWCFSKNRTARRFLLFLTFAFLLLAGRLPVFRPSMPAPGLAFYNVRDCAAVHCIGAGGTSWIASADTLQNTDRLKQLLRPHWLKTGLAEPVVLAGDFRSETVELENQIVTFSGKRICLLTDGRWRQKQAEHRLYVDFLYVSSGYRGMLEEVLELFEVGEVVLDASLTDFYRNRMQQSAKELDIPVHDLAEIGLLEVPL